MRVHRNQDCKTLGLYTVPSFYKKQKIRACAENVLCNGIDHFITLRFAVEKLLPVSLSTHVVGSSTTLIDNIFTNFLEFVTVLGNLLCQLVDHLLQFLVLHAKYEILRNEVKMRTKQAKKITSRIHSKKKQKNRSIKKLRIY